jgi:hypothetical protein
MDLEAFQGRALPFHPRTMHDALCSVRLSILSRRSWDFLISLGSPSGFETHGGCQQWQFLKKRYFNDGTELTIVIKAITISMKTGFSFYFRMVICTSVLCALVYALGEKTVEQHTSLAFGMLSTVMAGIGGMIRHLPHTPAEERTK